MEKRVVKCDKCGNEIDLTAEARESLKAEIKEVCSEGTKLKDKIEEIESKNREAEANNLKIRQNAEKDIENKLSDIASKREELLRLQAMDKERYEEQKQEIMNRIQVARGENADKQKELATRIGYLETEKMNVIEHNAKVDTIVNQNAKCEADKARNAEDVQNCKNKIEQLKLAIDAGKQYNSVKLKKQAESINKHLNRVSIQFEKMTKDGELKDDFKVLMDGKEFSKLSGSEKIKAGLEIANLLMNVQDMYIPIFIDDGERINVIPELDTQMIVTKVTKDKEINVEVGE